MALGGGTGDMCVFSFVNNNGNIYPIVDHALQLEYQRITKVQTFAIYGIFRPFARFTY